MTEEWAEMTECMHDWLGIEAAGGTINWQCRHCHAVWHSQTEPPPPYEPQLVVTLAIAEEQGWCKSQ